MNSLVHSPLGEIAKLNPIFRAKGVAPDELVDFLPMSALNAELTTVSATEQRTFEAVQKGYTNFADGDVLLAKITPCFENGKIAFAQLNTEFGFGSTEFHVIRVDKARLDGRYLVHFLRRNEIRLDGARNMTGSGGQRRVPKHYLDSLSVPLPALSEQRRIAAILDQTDELRAKRREAVAQLDSLTQSIFIEMFGDPVTNPKTWPRLTLNELMDKKGPQNGLYKPATDYGTGTPILRIDAFYDGVVTKLNSLKRVRLSASELKLYGLNAGDIVINRVNSMEYLGKSALIPKLSEPTVFESNMMRFSVMRDLAEPGYVVQFLQTEFIKSQILASSKNAVNQSSINQQDVKGFQINLPPVKLQETFAAHCTAVEAVKTTHRAAIANLDALFASLQHRAFRGEL